MEFSWKKNLAKALIGSALAGGAAGFMVLADALEKGEFDWRKITVGASVAISAGIAESLRNFLKNTIH